MRCRVLPSESSLKEGEDDAAAGGPSAKGKVFSNVHVTGKEQVVLGNMSGGQDAEGEEVEAETYVWIAGEDRLEAREWDFAEFQREKLRFWAGDGADEEYAGKFDSAY